MPKVRVKFVVLFILSIFVLGTFILKVAGGLSQNVTTASAVGTPLVFHRENDIMNTNITQVLETEDAVFLVYGYKSIVQAYSPEGTYLYTLSVYDYANGRAEIAFSKNKDILYLSDKHLNMYAFSGEDFLEFIDKSQSWDLYTTLNFGSSSPNYSIKAGSVWYTDAEETRCVVQRSIWQSLYQSNALDLLLLFLLTATGMVLRFPYPARKSNMT